MQLETRQQRVSFVEDCASGVIVSAFLGGLFILGWMAFIEWLRFGIQHRPNKDWEFWVWDNLQYMLYVGVGIGTLLAIVWAVARWIDNGKVYE